MYFDKKKLFIIALFFWIVIFGALIFSKEYILKTGTDILLKIEPVDPRDLFRGDYVRLRYSISRINLNETEYEETESFERDDLVYVNLAADIKYAYPTKVSKLKPKDGIFIKGKINYAYVNNVCELEYIIDKRKYTNYFNYCNKQYQAGSIIYLNASDDKTRIFSVNDTETSHYNLKAKVISNEQTMSLNITYGIERYYVPENKGKSIEKATRALGADVLVSISKNGNPVIKDLLINEESINYDNLKTIKPSRLNID